MRSPTSDEARFAEKITYADFFARAAAGSGTMVQGPSRVELELRRRRCKRDSAPPRAKTVALLGHRTWVRAYSGTTLGDAFGWRELSLRVHLRLKCATPGQLRVTRSCSYSTPNSPSNHNTFWTLKEFRRPHPPPEGDRNLARVRDRVQRGGHDIPEAGIRRRYTASLANLVSKVPGACKAELEFIATQFLDTSRSWQGMP
jgi:hypothetical protein